MIKSSIFDPLIFHYGSKHICCSICFSS
ncbi:hypothetical protein EVU92_06180 [Pseudoalteromonas sp. MEBiC 03485]|nr:hypothetical protein EVU92_06180 [Pseudoalteromonas sp. MEBiC 03485]